ncbi:MAG: DUF3696 domain-containing protein [Bacteroidetes bacterium]|jgi:predicted ATPase|nr:DUF3696 domain-containing protein [Bacteroidota bacterium]MBT6684689.1 DUF3696 domain-containing protein [Bacteroidota bacterium]MBT7143125.1 DUF3696 domain-containing protein [Bacteroidota bacterium]MBT7492525.1 DUF3696 domain-containing protein [Bacteroidota bacterium]
MIKSIELRNFKCIKDKHFHLRNLNVLLGLNGQGKSSFIQSLLVLRQSSEKLNKGILSLNGDLIRIGNSRDALYQYAKDKLTINLQLANEEPYNMIFDYEKDSDIFIIGDSNKKTENNFPNDDTSGLFGNTFQYLNANRIEPKSHHSKSLSNVSYENSLGAKGEYTVHYLEVRASESIEFENCLHSDTTIITTNKNEKLLDKSLIHQVNLWLGEISPNINVKTDNISSDFVKLEYEYNQPTFGKTMAFKPENVGFGISYALHVVTALLAAKSGSLIIIESPESHIHPRGQAELGKLISLVSKNNVQIIIETHSDHILNGIRVGIKENPDLKNNCILFYFKKIVEEQEQYSAITDIKIDENGTLSDYPKNLLDEWSNLLSKLI